MDECPAHPTPRILRRWRWISLGGLGCASACAIVGVPVLTLWLSNVEWVREQEHVLTGLLLGMGLGMNGAVSLAAVRRHGRPGPLTLSVFSAALLVPATFHVVPRVVGWIGVVGLLMAWGWDGRLLHAGLSCHTSSGDTRRHADG